ncbi:tol-pal system protein YbgF [Andreprevotia lacus DSM 23236]|jgi:tol-pal system protein YbgF|uniref:Cell division coordinator CpoB n=1 Tax=Andreprevotia lacus DSM 23236 TaxID=1121001 RepID=A0A1W1Y1G3_9NEIS|nr:tol-pal system protein YbgF [Andreprevotia lacus]SMC29641.1 tol-pal system protein YbgF [Andreprevotia lacus DSM 23236]
MKKLAALMMLAFAVNAHAGLFDDSEARKQIDELRTQVQQQQQQNQQQIVQLQTGSRRVLDLVNEIEQLKQDNANLRGVIEVLQFNLDEATKRQKDLYVDLDNRVRKIEEAKVEQAKEQASAAQQSESQSFDAAVALSRAAKHKEAVAAFRQFLTDYPNSANAPAAQYWLGSSLTALKDYKGASAAYGTVVSKYPDDAVAPDALFGLAVVANVQKDKKTAKQYLLQLIEKYPQSEKAATAKKALLATD